ncbi:PREDICTED: mitotic spindle assembly checkpoint protein MAD1 [Cyphomyrmex costatus]|uniref:Mitotic spindle assembly checkpoint protein MAD1 n=1 Tax=Cyphomyrmex costatus TaxID=456900 RepID=A0A195CPL5_9HYME|nr:PREDICTED: mitotic spindle assembly checkpoint protein MAD1 [Cyphomyrmex costatus]XP_018395521.1 PREDICTED: mitotic spindle assembly checkpoint protein MAD1 [Cyphomyrmex costatus]KYN02678.1 Mitotic spindle assembly checkpoint protein MAD1 [Cyphomyrmex costatus]
MSDQDPTSIIKMLKDLRSGAESYRRSVGVRFSGTGYISSKFNEDSDNSISSPKRPRVDEADTSTNNKIQSDCVPGSPWEWRRMKGEVISLKTKLMHQEAAVQQLHNIRRQMEEVFEKEKGLLQVQTEQDKQTIQQLEVRLDVARRTIQDTKDSRDTAEKEWSQAKNNLERKITSLLNENAKLSEDLRNISVNEKSPPPKDINESSELQMKLETVETRAAILEEKMKEYFKMQQDHELQNVELQSMKMKIEKLESERALWEEGKLLAGRAARANDLEKELNAAKKTIVVLKESVKEKLLLEEQMANMTKRLEHTEKIEQQVAMLEAKRSELALRLQEYETIGITGGPTVMKRELNRLQQSEVDLIAEEGQLRSKLDAVIRESQNLSNNYEEARKLVTDMTLSKDKLNKLVNRLQKKMILVTRERDSYRQQLDMYEKEITIDGNNAMTERIPALERVIDGYRDLVSKLEMDLQTVETGTQKNEYNKLKEEIEQLRGELEHRALKGDFNCNARVLHFMMNPASIAEKQAEEKQAALLQEVEELRAKVASGNYGATVSSLQIQEIAELKQTHEIKIARLKDAFKASSQEYRQACYQLFGWRVDRTKEGCYKLSSQYAESPNDFLFFHVGEEGVDMLETDFSANLGNLIEQYLQKQHSVPMFLNAVQSDLFSQQTVTNVMI